MKYIFELLIRFYQIFISPLKPPCCRFYPSCSSYALTAVKRFGAVKGGYLAIKRFFRCNPWNPGGVDFVPEEYHFFQKKKICNCEKKQNSKIKSFR